MNETNPVSVTEEAQEQKQLALDIISSNGLVVVNDTVGVVDRDTGSGSGDEVGTAEKEVTCVRILRERYSIMKRFQQLNIV